MMRPAPIALAFAGALFVAAAASAADPLAVKLAKSGFVLIEIEENNHEPAKLPPADFEKQYVNHYSYDRPKGELMLHRCEERHPEASSKLAIRYQLIQGRIAPPDQFVYIDRVPFRLEPVRFAPSVIADYTPFRRVRPIELDRLGGVIDLRYGDVRRRLGPGEQTQFAQVEEVQGRVARTELTIANHGVFVFDSVRPAAGAGRDCLYRRKS
jgi:hypothetical protein